MSCPEIGLQKSGKIWKNIQEKVFQNGNRYIQNNLKDSLSHIITLENFK